MSDPHARTVGSYFLWIALAACASFALVWVYIFAFPLGFYYTNYAVWLAKDRMLATCDTGALAVFGDSLPQAGFIPLRLPVTAANLAMNAGSPIETYYEVKRMLDCAHPAARIVLSLTPTSFGGVSTYFWSTSLRTGILGWTELSEITAAARRLHDPSLDHGQSDDGLSGPARNILNLVRFPPLFFSSLWQGQVFMRHAENLAMLQRALAGRGFVPFGTGGGFGLGVAGATETIPAVAPLDDYYFDLTLALLRDRGIAVDFVLMPMSDQQFGKAPQDGVARFAAYLRQYQARYGNFHVADTLSHWPDEFFGDGVHLTLRGAEIFSDRFGQCLARAPSGALDCDFDWRVAVGAKRAEADPTP